MSQGLKLILLIIISQLIVSCTARRLIPDGSYLVHKNTVELKEKKEGFSRSDLAAFVGQRPNKSFLGVRFPLWVYYQTNDKTDKKFWKWINEKVGSPPVYFEEGAAEAAANQMTRYLNNVGYFNSTVVSEAKIIKYKAEVIYKVETTTPYRINEFEYAVADSALAAWIEVPKASTPIKTGTIYNVYQLDEERGRITDYLKNNGFYNFSRDFVFYEVDSIFGNYTMNVKMRIDSINTDQGQKAHQRYFINKVTVFPNFKPALINDPITDSSKLDVFAGRNREQHELYFYSVGDMRMRPQTFGQIIQLHNGEPFSMRKLKQTYRGLGNFRIFSTTTIDFTDFVRQDTNFLDARIELQRNKVHAYDVEVEGTNSAGDLGLRGSLVYSNKNLFRGAELFRFSIKGGVEAQRVVPLAGEDQTTTAALFNTNELGVNANLVVPRFLSPVKFRNFVLEYQPKTSFNLGYSSQHRANYDRQIVQTNFGYDWMTSNTIQHIFTPVNLNSVKVNPSAAFQEILDQETNQRIKDQYSNHLILGLKYSFVFNNQNINKIKNFSYFRANFESSGNLLSLFNHTPLISSDGDHRELLGIRYAQFARFDFDFRQYFLLSKNNQLVLRAIIGFGLPYGNSIDIPFERSFYGGGANGMRGWVFRELGPGGFNGEGNVERIGDIQLETSFEYRFPISGFLKGAIFTDIGNIWTINENTYLPDGAFDFHDFYKQLAVDAGFGFRFDFSFFIFRLDAALPLRNPAKEPGTRWVVGQSQMKDIIWNFGIGYPF
ncbi:MAG: BamA/TamA family outer membrane protein [Bacteroidales bacterium]|jgi:outer membrane translocation and assembly module TamA|nr:BamA/TamA family outer membrane protein [Bacteroidales bacterium]